MTGTLEESFESIEGLELTPEMKRAFASDGIVAPTAVQLATIAPILAGHHVVIQSGTGTGKTLAYLLPVLQGLRERPGTRAVCMAPSAELALQTLGVADRYKSESVRSVGLVAGGSQRQQKARLQKSTQLVIGTPGRVLEMFAQRKLRGVTTLVLDEAEPILGGKDIHYLAEILSRPEPKVQLIFAAATFGNVAEDWIREKMGSAVVRPAVLDSPLHTLIEHRTLRIADESKRDIELARFLENRQRVIVFVNQSRLLRHVYRFLSDSGLRVVSVSPERSKQQNQEARHSFARGKSKILLTTDSAATGLDFAEVQWVVHYEMPTSAAAYLHRAGRTGRAGKQGCSVLLLSAGDKARWSTMASELDIELSRHEQ